MDTRTNSKTILIIDDQKSHRKFLAETLQLEGFSIILAESVEKAESYLNSDTVIDLITLDQRMYPVSGTSFLTKTRQHPKIGRIPVIMITAYPEDSDINIEIQAEFYREVRIIKKPLSDYHEVTNTAKELLGFSGS